MSMLFQYRRGLASPPDAQADSLRRIARLGGLFYLVFITLFAAATYMRSQIIVFGDAATTAQNIAANELMFRMAFVTEIVSAVFFVLAAWTLYILLRSVNRDLALLFFLLNLGGVVVECVNMLNLFAALPLLSGDSYLNAFSAAQLQAQALLCINMYQAGIVLAQIFFGLWLLPLGMLVYHSGFLPRWLGVLLVLDFFAVMIWFGQHFLFPGYETASYPGLAISFLAEVSLTLWLLVKGVAAPAATAKGEVE